MCGQLYLCATPIGNLADITNRVIDTLKMVDVIAAEDTRNSIKLLNHFDIHTPMTSYHEHNKFDKAEDLIRQMREGKNIALITDAGTPAISDPGEVLVKRCMEEDIVVTSLPGAAAVIVALTLSGISTRRFCFEGFLPIDKKERKLILTSLENETRTIVLYESPHHIKITLNDLINQLGNRHITICKELTKKFEKVMSFTIKEAIELYENEAPRGEYVIIIEGKDINDIHSENIKKWEELTINEHMDFYLGEGLDKKEAMKSVAKDRGISKRDVYANLLNN